MQPYAHRQAYNQVAFYLGLISPRILTGRSRCDLREHPLPELPERLRLIGEHAPGDPVGVFVKPIISRQGTSFAKGATTPQATGIPRLREDGEFPM